MVLCASVVTRVARRQNFRHTAMLEALGALVSLRMFGPLRTTSIKANLDAADVYREPVGWFHAEPTDGDTITVMRGGHGNGLPSVRNIMCFQNCACLYTCTTRRPR